MEDLQLANRETYFNQEFKFFLWDLLSSIIFGFCTIYFAYDTSKMTPQNGMHFLTVVGIFLGICFLITHQTYHKVLESNNSKLKSFVLAHGDYYQVVSVFRFRIKVILISFAIHYIFSFQALSNLVSKSILLSLIILSWAQVWRSLRLTFLQEEVFFKNKDR